MIKKVTHELQFLVILNIKFSASLEVTAFWPTKVVHLSKFSAMSFKHINLKHLNFIYQCIHPYFLHIASLGARIYHK